MSDGEVDWAEKRDALRQRTFKHGRVAVKGVETMQCVIRNMSLTGARIAVQNAAALPDRFELFIGDEATHREVEVMSRSRESAGLRFLKPLTARDLGAEFMSERSTTTHRAERVAARANAETGAEPRRAAVSPPPMDDAEPTSVPARETAVGHHSEQATGLRKLRPAPLPPALQRHLPWGA